MQKVRLGVIGVGNMGSYHAQQLLAGKIVRAKLGAVCDVDPARRAQFPKVKRFADSRALIRSGLVDAVLIATPHYAHTTIGMDALRQGLHVLTEKPVSVHKADAVRLLAAHTNRRQVFAVMLNQRTDPYFQKIRALARGGELGELRRIHWTMTDWFRTEAYYASSGWRATWAGEGGGVLLNQATHNLDLWQWLFGLPARVRAECRFGRYHDIEVEDDVTAYLEYASGATALFVTTTGEAPGTNRLEVTGERGRLVYENDRISFTRNETPTREFSRTTKESFAAPPTWEIAIPARDHGGQHVEVLQNFAAAILDGAPLIAPAAEGIRSVELANAMLLSTWLDRTIELPLNAAAYERQLKKRIAKSRYQKPAATGAVADLSASWK